MLRDGRGYLQLFGMWHAGEELHEKSPPFSKSVCECNRLALDLFAIIVCFLDWSPLLVGCVTAPS